jgi:vitamin B12 transporter
MALSVSGRVLDQQQKPIAEAVVSVGDFAVFTAADGIFHLRNISARQKILVHKIGYQDRYFLPQQVSMSMILQREILATEGISVSRQRQQRASLNSSDMLVIENRDNRSSDLAELLQNYADIHVKGSQLLGGKRTIKLGGNKSKHTLVMLDGVALNINGEDFDISSIPAALIDRVEIIQNNAGAIGGSGAIGGIVNIISRDQLDYDASSGKTYLFSNLNTLQMGSFGLRKAQTQLSFSQAIFQAYALYSQAKATNDFSYYNKLTQTNETRDNNASEIIDSALRLSLQTDRFQSKYNLIYQDYFKQLPGAISTLSLFDQSHKEGYTLRQHLNLAYQYQMLQFYGDFFYTTENSDYDNTQSSGGLMQASQTDFSKQGATLGSSYNWQNLVKMDFSALYDRQQFSYEQKYSAAPTNEQEMENYALKGAMIATWNFFPVEYELALNSRYDMPQATDELDFESELSNRLDYKLSYRNWFDLAIGGSWGNSYQIPSFYDLHWKEGSQAIGNPDLLPESSYGWNLFYHLILPQTTLKMSYSKQEIDNLIRWYRSLNYWKPGNIGSAELTNYQIQASYNLWKDITSSISWQRTFGYNKSLTEEGFQSDHYNKNLTYTPTSQTELSLQVPWQNFSWQISYSRTGRQWSTDDNLRQPIAAFSLINSNLNYHFSYKKMTVNTSFALNNLLDQDYETSDLVPKPGRNWLLSINFELKI